MEITGISSVLPLKSTVLPVVLTPNFTTDFHCYTTGISRAIFYVVYFAWCLVMVRNYPNITEQLVTST